LKTKEFLQPAFQMFLSEARQLESDKFVR